MCQIHMLSEHPSGLQRHERGKVPRVKESRTLWRRGGRWSGCGIMRKQSSSILKYVVIIDALSIVLIISSASALSRG